MAKTSMATQQETLQTHAKYERLIARAKGVESAKTLIVHPCDETSLRGAIEAAAANLIVPILVGPAAKISAVARTHKLDLGGIEICSFGMTQRNIDRRRDIPGRRARKGRHLVLAPDA